MADDDELDEDQNMAADTLEVAMENGDLKFQMDALKHAFEAFDEDDSGTLDAEELRKILTRVGSGAELSEGRCGPNPEGA